MILVEGDFLLTSEEQFDPAGILSGQRSLLVPSKYVPVELIYQLHLLCQVCQLQACGDEAHPWW